MVPWSTLNRLRVRPGSAMDGRIRHTWMPCSEAMLYAKTYSRSSRLVFDMLGPGRQSGPP